MLQDYMRVRFCTYLRNETARYLDILGFTKETQCITNKIIKELTNGPRPIAYHWVQILITSMICNCPLSDVSRIKESVGSLILKNNAEERLKPLPIACNIFILQLFLRQPSEVTVSYLLTLRIATKSHFTSAEEISGLSHSHLLMQAMLLNTLWKLPEEVLRVLIPEFNSFQSEFTAEDTVDLCIKRNPLKYEAKFLYILAHMLKNKKKFFINIFKEKQHLESNELYIYDRNSNFSSSLTEHTEINVCARWHIPSILDSPLPYPVFKFILANTYNPNYISKEIAYWLYSVGYGPNLSFMEQHFILLTSLLVLDPQANVVPSIYNLNRFKKHFQTLYNLTPAPESICNLFSKIPKYAVIHEGLKRLFYFLKNSEDTSLFNNTIDSIISLATDLKFITSKTSKWCLRLYTPPSEDELDRSDFIMQKVVYETLESLMEPNKDLMNNLQECLEKFRQISNNSIKCLDNCCDVLSALCHFNPKLFANHLEKVLSFCQEYISYLPAAYSPYKLIDTIVSYNVKRSEFPAPSQISLQYLKVSTRNLNEADSEKFFDSLRNVSVEKMISRAGFQILNPILHAYTFNSSTYESCSAILQMFKNQVFLVAEAQFVSQITFMITISKEILDQHPSLLSLGDPILDCICEHPHLIEPEAFDLLVCMALYESAPIRSAILSMLKTLPNDKINIPQIYLTVYILNFDDDASVRCPAIELREMLKFEVTPELIEKLYNYLTYKSRNYRLPAAKALADALSMNKTVYTKDPLTEVTAYFARLQNYYQQPFIETLTEIIYLYPIESMPQLKKLFKLIFETVVRSNDKNTFLEIINPLEILIIEILDHCKEELYPCWICEFCNACDAYISEQEVKFFTILLSVITKKIELVKYKPLEKILMKLFQQFYCDDWQCSLELLAQTCSNLIRYIYSEELKLLEDSPEKLFENAEYESIQEILQHSNMPQPLKEVVKEINLKPISDIYIICAILKGCSVSSKFCGASLKYIMKVHVKIDGVKNKKSLDWIDALLQVFSSTIEPEYGLSIFNTLMTCGIDNVNMSLNYLFSFYSKYGIKIILNHIKTNLILHSAWKTRNLVLNSIEEIYKKFGFYQDVLSLFIGTLNDMHPVVKANAAKKLTAFCYYISSNQPNKQISELTTLITNTLMQPDEKTLVELFNKLIEVEFTETVDTTILTLLSSCIEKGLNSRLAQLKKQATALICTLCYVCPSESAFYKYFSKVKSALLEALFHSSPEIRGLVSSTYRVIVNIFGKSFIDIDLFFNKLRSPVSTERMGAANAISQILAALGTEKLSEILPEILEYAENEDFNIRDGYLSLIVFLPNAFKEDFQEFVPSVLPILLRSLSLDSEQQRDVAYKAAELLVTKYGTTHTALLLTPLENAIFHSNPVIRGSAVSLLGLLAENVSVGNSEISEISSLERRSFILCSLYTARFDCNATVKRQATTIWKNIVHNTPKTLKKIMPILLRRLCNNLGKSNPQKQIISLNCIDEFVTKFPEEVLNMVLPTLAGMLSNPETAKYGATGIQSILPHISAAAVQQNFDKFVEALQAPLANSDTEVRSAAAKCMAVLIEILEDQHHSIIEDIVKRICCVEPVNTQDVRPFLLESLQIILCEVPLIGPTIIKNLSTLPCNVYTIKVLGLVSFVNKFKNFKTLYDLCVSSVFYQFTEYTLKNSEDCSSNELLDSLIKSLEDIGAKAAVYTENSAITASDLCNLYQSASKNNITDPNIRFLAYVLMKSYFNNCEIFPMPILKIFDNFSEDVLCSKNSLLDLKAVEAFAAFVKCSQKLGKLSECIKQLEKTLKKLVLYNKDENFTLIGMKNSMLTNSLCELFQTGLTAGVMDVPMTSASCFRMIISKSPYEGFKPKINILTGFFLRACMRLEYQKIRHEIISILEVLFMSYIADLRVFITQLQIILISELFSGSTQESVLKLLRYLVSRPDARLDSLLNDIGNRLKELKSKSTALQEQIIKAIMDILSCKTVYASETTSHKFMHKLQELMLSDVNEELQSLAAKCLLKYTSVQKEEDKISFFEDYVLVQFTSADSQYAENVYSVKTFWNNEELFNWVKLCIYAAATNELLQESTTICISRMMLMTERQPNFIKQVLEVLPEFVKILTLKKDDTQLLNLALQHCAHFIDLNHQLSFENKSSLLKIAVLGISTEEEHIINYGLNILHQLVKPGSSSLEQFKDSLTKDELLILNKHYDRRFVRTTTISLDISKVLF